MNSMAEMLVALEALDKRIQETNQMLAQAIAEANQMITTSKTLTEGQGKKGNGKLPANYYSTVE